MPPVAERLRRAYPALPEWDGVGSIPANSNAQNVPSFRRWRFEMKLSPCSIQGRHYVHVSVDTAYAAYPLAHGKLRMAETNPYR